jgi:hypothetical protein
MLVQRRRGAEDKCEEERAQRCKGNGSAAVHGSNLFQLRQKRNRVATGWLTTARASCHSDRSGGIASFLLLLARWFRRKL